MDLELTLKERLTLANQYEILAKLSDDKYDTDYYNNLSKILIKGFSRNYYELISEFDKDGLSQEECKFVVDVLNLYSEFRFSWRESKEVRDNLEESKTLFKGFDLNENSNLLGYYEYLVKDAGLWPEIKDLMKEGKIKDFNSHGNFPYINKLKEMLKKWEEVKIKKGEDDESGMLTLEEINYIWK